MKLPIIAIVTGFALTASSASAQTFLCIADRSTGFYFNESSKDWETSSFNVSDNRYIIKKSDQQQYSWEVNKFGEDDPFFPLAGCNDDFSEFGFLSCSGLMGTFKFNRTNGRYIRFYQGQYIAYNPNSDFEMLRNDGGDTPFVEIGKCSRI